MILLALSQGLAWKAARTFDGKAAPLPLAFLGMITVALAIFTPGSQYITGAVGPAVGAVYIASIAIGLWLGRAERLPARGPLIVLTAVHAVTLTIGMYSFFNRANFGDYFLSFIRSVLPDDVHRRISPRCLHRPKLAL